MKPLISKHLLAVLLMGLLPAALSAQWQQKIGHLRAYDKTGINQFETSKSDTTTFNGLGIRFGAGFTQEFQALKHKNNTFKVPGNALYAISPGFNTANANLYVDIQLADGIRLNLTSYLSSRHHNETWVKGGYIQFDKLPFNGKVWDDIMKYATIKVGHMEINYGDQHFRRTDGGHTFYNPFMESYILDAFTTEIGGEIYGQYKGWLGMVGITNGMIKGNIDSLKKETDGNVHKSPALYFKLGKEYQISDALRARLTASFYHNSSSAQNTLYGGDRTGSNYFMVMEKATGTSYKDNAFSGRLNPGFTKKVDAFMVNGFLKAAGFEFFGTYENGRGRSKAETVNRTVNQYAVDGLYRFGNNENLYVGVRYNHVKGRLQGMTDDMSIQRMALAGGWFLTKNILLKGEWVDQKYFDFPANDLRSSGRFKGYVIAATVGF